MSEPKETLTPKEISDLIEKKMRMVSARTRASVAPAQVFQLQADATYAGTPATGVAEDVLTTTQNVRIICISCTPVFSGGASHLIEIHLTIDGQSYTFQNAAPVSTTTYNCSLDGAVAETAQTLGTTKYEIYRSFLLEGRSVAITFELTTDGTPGASTARVRYAKIP